METTTVIPPALSTTAWNHTEIGQLYMATIYDANDKPDKQCLIRIEPKIQTTNNAKKTCRLFINHTSNVLLYDESIPWYRQMERPFDPLNAHFTRIAYGDISSSNSQKKPSKKI